MFSVMNGWTWSEPYQKWYCVVGYDANRQPIYEWTDYPQPRRRDSVMRANSGTYYDYQSEPLSDEARRRLEPRNLIPGDPNTGSYEELDRSYHMRTDARRFFRRGRVFSLLHHQNYAQTAPITSNVSVVKYGEKVYSQIRRFVVVREKHGYCYACPISTYSERGTLKPGADPKEHAMICFENGTANLLDGEKWGGKDGLKTDMIRVHPADVNLQMHHASRVHFAKEFPIEWNVKVKDIGTVLKEDMEILLAYYEEARR